MKFTIQCNDISLGSTVDIFKTVLAAYNANTVGYRFKLLRMKVAFADDTPADAQIGIQLKRVASVSAGGAGTYASAVTPNKVDTESRASIVTAGEDCITSGGVEPTTYETDPLDSFEVNARNGLLEVWDYEDAYTLHKDQLLGVLMAPRDGGTAYQATVTLTIEEF